MGSLRRECLNHFIFLSEGHLRRTVRPTLPTTTKAVLTRESQGSRNAAQAWQGPPLPRQGTVRSRSWHARCSANGAQAGSVVAGYPPGAVFQPRQGTTCLSRPPIDPARISSRGIRPALGDSKCPENLGGWRFRGARPFGGGCRLSVVNPPEVYALTSSKVTSPPPKHRAHLGLHRRHLLLRAIRRAGE
jgi:hypothetical protein